MNPRDPENRNEARAERAYRTLLGHIEKTPHDEEDIRNGTAISDLMADLLHVGEQYGFDAGDLLDMARTAYEGDSADGPPARRVV